MSSHYGLVTDLINQAKVSKDTQSKIFHLEQIKEIIFHREPSLLPHVIPEILDFMVDRTVSLHKFLIQLAGAALKRDYSLAPSIISLFNFIVADAQENTIRTLGNELAKSYDILVIAIANIQKKTAGHQAKDLWNQLKYTTQTLLDMLPTSRSEIIRLSCLQLAQSVVMFGYPGNATTNSNIKRLQRHNITEIPLHHPNIDKNTIHSEAEVLLSKMALWARRGGPQENPFTDSEMTQLSRSLGKIAVERTSAVNTAALSLSFLLERKGNESYRQQLIPIVEEVITVNPAPSILDLDNPLMKLRVSLRRVKELAVISVEGDSKVISKKRSFGSMDGGGGRDGDQKRSQDEGDEADGEADLDVDEEDRTEESEEWRQSVIEAVDLAQNALPQALTPRALSTPGSGGDSSARNTASESTVELSSELPAFPDPAASLRLVPTEDAGRADTTALTMMSTTNSLGSVMLRVSEPPSSQVYANMALESLQRILDNMKTHVKQLHPNSLQNDLFTVFQFQISIRLVLTLTRAELDSGRPLMKVPIVTSSMSALAIDNANKIPRHVGLPRPLWIFASHILSSGLASSGSKGSMTSSSFSLPTELLSALLRELYTRASTLSSSSLSSDDTDSSSASSAETKEEDYFCLYDSLCLALLTRFLQRRDLRPFAQTFLELLPVIPSSSVSLVGLVAMYGSKSAPNVPSFQRRNQGTIEERDKGTSTLAMSLLSKIIYTSATHSEEEMIGGEGETALLSHTCKDALQCLLWASVSADFGMRSKAVGLLVEDVMSKCGDLVQSEVCSFAFHSAISLLGPAIIRKVHESDNEKNSNNRPQAKESSPSGHEMDIDQGDEGEVSLVSLADAAQGFDLGESFGKRFSTLNNTPYCKEIYDDMSAGLAVVPGTAIGDVEAFVRRHLHLLCQLSLGLPHLLKALVELFVAAQEFELDDDKKTKKKNELENSPQDPSSSSSSLPTTGDKGVGAVVLNADGPDDKPDGVPSPPQDEKLYKIVSRVVEKELLHTLVPALARSSPASYLFKSLRHVSPVARSLVLQSLELLLPDPHMPPDEDLILEIRKFAKECNEQHKEAMTEELVTPKGDELVELSPTFEQDLELRLLATVAGGLPAEELLQLLPRMVRALGSGAAADLEILRRTFSRIVQARPPPLSQSALLVALHRIDHTAVGMKTKSLLEAIGLCLSNKEVFRSENIKEAITTLMMDENLSISLMRTVILSSQTHADLKKFGLCEVVPRLVQNKTWEKAPRVWEGVAMFIKNFVTHRDAEPSLRAILGLPVAQLRAMIKVATTARAPLAKLLKALSAEEQVEVISGRWVGLLVDSDSGNSGNNDVVEKSKGDEDVLKADSEKMKLIKEIQANVVVK
eukprot:gene2034-3952_t